MLNHKTSAGENTIKNGQLDLCEIDCTLTLKWKILPKRSEVLITDNTYVYYVAGQTVNLTCVKEAVKPEIIALTFSATSSWRFLWTLESSLIS